MDVADGDIARPGPWQDRAAGCDLVIHTAAIVSLAGNRDRFWEVNVRGTRNALDAAVRGAARRFVHFSSVTVYGNDYPDGADERWPVRPTRAPYVTTKIAAEQVVLAERRIETTVVRPGDVYGPGSKPWIEEPLNLLRARRLALPLRGRGVVTPVHVDDLVEGVAAAAGVADGEGEIFNLAGPAVEARLYFGRLAAEAGLRAPVLVPGRRGLMALATLMPGPQSSPASVEYLTRRGGYGCEKARRVLGWEPRVVLEDGLRETVRALGRR